jgi:hypothetical protein
MMHQPKRKDRPAFRQGGLTVSRFLWDQDKFIWYQDSLWHQDDTNFTPMYRFVPHFAELKIPSQKEIRCFQKNVVHYSSNQEAELVLSCTMDFLFRLPGATLL